MRLEPDKVAMLRARYEDMGNEELMVEAGTLRDIADEATLTATIAAGVLFRRMQEQDLKMLIGPEDYNAKMIYGDKTYTASQGELGVAWQHLVDAGEHPKKYLERIENYQFASPEDAKALLAACEAAGVDVGGRVMYSYSLRMKNGKNLRSWLEGIGKADLVTVTEGEPKRVEFVRKGE